MTSARFRSMPPLRHDRDPARSAVLAHIQAATGCDLAQAGRTFHYLRNKGHLVFTKAGRTWKGVEYLAEESEHAYRARMAAENCSLRADLDSLQRLVAKLRVSHNALLIHVKGGG